MEHQVQIVICCKWMTLPQVLVWGGGWGVKVEYTDVGIGN